MINLITGVPGSGKTYLAINILINEFFQWDKLEQRYKLKDDSITIITNIDGLQLEHKPLADILAKHVSFDQFFTVDYQDKLHQKYKNIVYIIDECQQYIPRRFNNRDTVYYFDYHRHYGDTIYLITQDIFKITKDISSLCEFEYRACKTSFSVAGEFRYLIKSGGQIFDRKVCRRQKKIFDLYKSFNGKDQKIKRGSLFKIIIVLCIIFPIAFYCLYKRLTKNKDHPVKENPSYNHPLHKDSKKNDSLVAENGIQIIPIESKILINNKLYMIICPITQKEFYTFDIPYPVKLISGSYYAFLTHKQITDLHEKYNYIASSKNTSNKIISEKKSNHLSRRNHPIN
jgi:zona occludens toxin (predicted ATPase)